jgi:hypothetical protein
VPAVAAGLYALRPDEFTAARAALARDLAEAGDPQAAVVRKLRRPVGLAWILNHLAAAERTKVDALLVAGDQLRSGQAAALQGGGPTALREAEKAVHDEARSLRLEAGAALESAGRSPPPATLSRLELLLRVLATSSDEVRDRFRRGLLEREPEVGAGALGGFLSAEGANGSGPTVPKASESRAAKLEDRGADDRAHRERRATEVAQRRAEAQAHAHAQEQVRQADRARRELERAERRAATAKAVVEALRVRMDAARAELDRAEAEVARCRGVLDGLEGSRNQTHR